MLHRHWIVKIGSAKHLKFGEIFSKIAESLIFTLVVRLPLRNPAILNRLDLALPKTKGEPQQRKRCHFL